MQKLLAQIYQLNSSVQTKVRQYTTGSTDNTIDNNDLEGLESPVFGITA